MNPKHQVPKCEPRLEEMEEIRIEPEEPSPCFPEEIIEDILSRLPVKSLLKFRCVSKSWLSLIGSKRFIKTHLEISKRRSNLAHHRIIFNRSPRHRSLRHCSLSSLVNEGFTDSFELDDQLFQPFSVRVVGSCDGLICILIDRLHFLLWNPSTRMTKNLPAMVDNNNNNNGKISKSGFGFDEASGDYKVFGIVSVSLSDDSFESIGKVYSLKTNSWKTLQERDDSIFNGAGKLVNGALHWIRSFDLGSRWDIQSFDFKSEVYGVVEQPVYTEGVFVPILGVLDECLCVICDYQKNKFDFWILKQYGVVESWNKVVTVPYLDHPFGKRSFMTPFLIPFFIGPEREILFAYGQAFIIYHPKDNCYRHPQINNLDSFREASIYIESLVSFQPDGGLETGE